MTLSLRRFAGMENSSFDLSKRGGIIFPKNVLLVTLLASLLLNLYWGVPRIVDQFFLKDIARTSVKST